MNFTEEQIFEQMGRLYMANTTLNKAVTQLIKEKELEKIKAKENEDKNDRRGKP